MSIHVALRHRTRYEYDRPVSLGPHIVRLRPAPHSRTRVLSYSLRVLPVEHFVNWQQDPQSNYLARLVFPSKARELMVEVDLIAEMAVLNPFDFFLEPEAERFPFKYDPILDEELAPFRTQQSPDPLLASFLSSVRRDSVRTVDFLVEQIVRLAREIRYVIRMEPGVQSPEETLRLKSGSCRDSAWLLCQILRHLGFAARFVSGYLIQLVPDAKPLDGPAGPSSDFTDLHAWCEVYLPGAGWIGLDPTSGLFAGEGHIPLAATPEPRSAAPIDGALDPCEVTFSHHMEVTRIAESTRVTKPYTDEQWAEIDQEGRKVDADLARDDCRLTMGGEPTFVAIEKTEEAEWNTEALGPRKRILAADLLQRLKRRFSTGSLLHYGQGKWYPGEPLPRWAFACYWRVDGAPIWNNEALFAEDSKDYGHGPREASEFMEALAARLGCDKRWIIPGYEDVWYYLWKEHRLPVNVDPFDSNLKDERERTRLAKIFQQGLDQVVGYILPLWRPKGPGPGPAPVPGPGPAPAPWLSGAWFLRGERCHLTPGDSPMGFRLPLDSLPWAAPGDLEPIFPRDPSEPLPPLPPGQTNKWTRAALDPSRPRESSAPGEMKRASPPLTQVRPGEAPSDREPGSSAAPPPRGVSAVGVVRTALCVEPRGGQLRIFMPPLEALEDYLDLIAAIEETAEILGRPVVMEGYPPPFDLRLRVLKVTPDPGVIEVNIHPSRSWSELVSRTEGLYEEARLARLGAEKFMLDGRHTGTGGGNHVVLGGATPEESPLLRRPDLLRSLLGYWQNHPSLSFLFSGLFIGPTSQSPRVDEARNDSLRELELAFQQVPKEETLKPWLVDRLFRNLLIDATGNTHRAEFCIDKLYSPDGGAGRLGLLELRGFEMPPHARMSLAQQLLLRALIAKFWREPHLRKLVRWGGDIHDRWMLPHFVWNDFVEVLEDLRAAGYNFKTGWFAPHFEFRFPRLGDLAARGIHLDLRQALEPWHVLGEEGGAGGTARYVDSSLERLEVKVSGLVESRHLVTVGGVALPLHPTGVPGEFVAGVRYRAWQPPNALHPLIKVHTPLTFDIVDTWNERSIGGCVYHVTHPGGLGYTTFPVNAFEAESRRLSRFFRFGHTPGPMKPRRPEPNHAHPFTLDLRAES